MEKKSLYEELKFLSDIGFREIYKRFVYIHCRELLDEMLPGELTEDVTGIVAYCYIDKDEGLSFRPMLLAAMTGLSIKVYTFPHQEDTIFILRFRSSDDQKMSEWHRENGHMYLYALDPEKYPFLDMTLLDFPVHDFDDFKKMIDTSYDAGVEIENLRGEDFAFLDKFRNEYYPDDVRVLLFKEGNGIEEVWARLIFVHGKEFFGKLLNEPIQDFGCHKGSIIGIILTRSGDRRTLLFDGRVAEETNE